MITPSNNIQNLFLARGQDPMQKSDTKSRFSLTIYNPPASEAWPAALRKNYVASPGKDATALDRSQQLSYPSSRMWRRPGSTPGYPPKIGHSVPRFPAAIRSWQSQFCLLMSSANPPMGHHKKLPEILHSILC